jgi:penicillin-binding protein 1C
VRSAARARAFRWLRRALLTAAGGAFACAAAFLAFDQLHPFPLERLRSPWSSEVRAADGTRLAARVASDEQWRQPCELAELGPWLPAATLAVEDRRFRSHLGVDPLAVLRALASNVRAGAVREGASTLTMQLVALTLGSERTFSGKAVEAFRALQLERELDKDEILAAYLERAPYGRNVCGAREAAQRWFAKEPAELSLDEAALLAGLPQSPSRLRPDRHPEAARARRNVVLDRMHEQGRITLAQHTAAVAAPLQLSNAPAATDLDAFHASAWALSVRPQGGITTLDAQLQAEVERVVAAHLPHLPPGTDVAVVAIDVASASLAAHVGSADPFDPLDGEVDGARARRSPGSALKPFVFAAAFECGRLAADSVIDDTPLELDGWRPENFDGGFHGPVRADEALRRSLNLPALRIARAIGVERCVGVIEASGATLGADPVARGGLTLVTGGTGVTLVELTNAYATLARGGSHLPLRLFVDTPFGTPTRVFSAATCESLFTILSSDARAPNLRTGASLVGREPFAWKTGTSSGNVDAWAVGFDRRHALGVWVGRFDGSGHAAYVGALAAEPILAELFASSALARP